MLLQSSNVYTFQKSTERKRKFWLSTIALSVMSIAGAVGIDMALNPNAASVFSGVTAGNSSSSGSGTKSATSDAIDYRYGTIQVKVTKTNGKITAVDLVQAQATAGREQAFSYLVTDTIKANGTSFGTRGGATFTTDAFKQAVESAISKLG